MKTWEARLIGISPVDALQAFLIPNPYRKISVLSEELKIPFFAPISRCISGGGGSYS
jgi:hypothetical protein